MKIKTNKQAYKKSILRDVMNRVPMQFVMLLSVLLMLASCSTHKNLAYDFVNKAKGASVAFYVPDELKKTNLRNDCNPTSIDLVLLDEDQLQDTINSRIKILNKIEDEIFLDVMLASFEDALKDYDLKLQYWENENTTPDSLHWVVDLSHIEIQELVNYLLTDCGVEGNCEFIPSTTVNVASWFELINNDNESNVLFTEQNYDEYINDCYYTLDSLNNLIINVDLHHINIDGFYDFAVMLGKLYAGYSFDYFMNEYVKKEMRKKGLEYSDDIYMRYDPYESYIYYTGKDRLIEL